MLDLELQSQKKHLIFIQPRYLLKLLYLFILFPLNSYTKNNPVNIRVSEGQNLVCCEFVVNRYRYFSYSFKNLL